MTSVWKPESFAVGLVLSRCRHSFVFTAILFLSWPRADRGCGRALYGDRPDRIQPRLSPERAAAGRLAGAIAGTGAKAAGRRRVQWRIDSARRPGRRRGPNASALIVGLDDKQLRFDRIFTRPQFLIPCFESTTNAVEGLGNPGPATNRKLVDKFVTTLV